MADRTHTFTEVSHPLSDVTGVYVVIEDGVVQTICTALSDLRLWLGECTYASAANVKVVIAPVAGERGYTGADDITALIFQDWTNGVEDYETWQEHNASRAGKSGNGFMEHWFEEYGAEQQRDYIKRYEKIHGTKIRLAGRGL